MHEVHFLIVTRRRVAMLKQEFKLKMGAINWQNCIKPQARVCTCVQVIGRLFGQETVAAVFEIQSPKLP